MSRINVNSQNSILISDKLYISALKYTKMTPKLQEFVNTGNNLNHPTKGMFYEYTGNYSRS